MEQETSKQLIQLLQEQIRLLQIIAQQLEKVDYSIHQVFLK